MTPLLLLGFVAVFLAVGASGALLKVFEGIGQVVGLSNESKAQILLAAGSVTVFLAGMAAVALLVQYPFYALLLIALSALFLGFFILATNAPKQVKILVGAACGGVIVSVLLFAPALSPFDDGLSLPTISTASNADRIPGGIVPIVTVLLTLLAARFSAEGLRRSEKPRPAIGSKVSFSL